VNKIEIERMVQILKDELNAGSDNQKVVIAVVEEYKRTSEHILSVQQIDLTINLLRYVISRLPLYEQADAWTALENINKLES
jgi:hypothetical protein